MSPNNNNNNDALSQELMNLSSEESAIILGTVLGDGHIQKRGNSYRLKIEHGIKQRSYVDWKHKKLRRLCQTTQPPKTVIRMVDGKPEESVLFYTSSGKWLKGIYDLFYKEKDDRLQKVVTREFIDSLPMDASLLAVFFMDDGSVRNDCYSGKIATQDFSLDENHLLCEYLRKWNIEAKVVLHHEKNQQYYISIPTASFGTLIQIIEPIVRQIPEMEYKLNEIQKK